MGADVPTPPPADSSQSSESKAVEAPAKPFYRRPIWLIVGAFVLLALFRVVEGDGDDPDSGPDNEEEVVAEASDGEREPRYEDRRRDGLEPFEAPDLDESDQGEEPVEAPEVSIRSASWTGDEILMEVDTNLPGGAIMSWSAVDGDDWDDVDATEARGFATVSNGTATAELDVSEFATNQALVEVTFVGRYEDQPDDIAEAYGPPYPKEGWPRDWKEHSGDEISVQAEGTEPVADDAQEERVVEEFSGSGMHTTRPFEVTDGWEIQWEFSGDLLQIYLYDETGDPAGIAANQQADSSGSAYQARGGTYHLDINAIGEWTVRVVELP